MIDLTSASPLHGQVFVFPAGLVGCPTWRRFRFEQGAAGPTVHRLRGLDSDVSLFVVDPFTIDPDFSVELSDEEAAELDLSDPSEALVLVTLTVRESPRSITANLLGPLIVNAATGRGRQVVLNGSPYVVRHPVAA